MKTGRNDPCPCGSGKKYKKCCISKENSQPRIKNASISKNIPGLWVDDLSLKKNYYNSIDELYDEIRATGRVPHGDEYTYGDEETGLTRTIEVEELCRHGHPSGGSVTFDQTDDGGWEGVESGSGGGGPCVLCEILKEGFEIGCPECGKPFPEFTEGEILEIYTKGIEPLGITCPNCGCKFIAIDENGIRISEPNNVKE
ncbi:SEC-C metal-binding domain-containing protein [Methanococcoides sp. AM1]|uniref:SEC-C metal-binding domain-containing protein n=1 Tax=Methanococcoides sp. AM1 TaxID=1201011 RepID=UPI001AF01F76|nr:SEC-C metal-binding domain-containing protein [Methanococcoides sp. AM1]